MFKRQIIKDIFGTIIGAVIMGIGISLFLLPNQLSSGGIAGIATIAYYLLKIPMGTVIMIINIPLFIFAGYKIGKDYFVKSLIGTFSLSIFIDVFDRFPAITNDRFLACIYGGVIIGTGTAIILKANSSTGGTELIANLIKAYNPQVSISKYLTMIDIAIVVLNVIFFNSSITNPFLFIYFYL